MKGKTTLLNWLAGGDLNKTLKGLDFLARKYEYEQLQNDVTFQSGRLKALEEQRKKDIISPEDDRLETARIRDVLLQMSLGIPDEWSLSGIKIAPTITPVPLIVHWKKMVISAVAMIGVLAGFSEFSGYSIRDLLKKKEAAEKSVEKEAPAPKASTSGDNSPAIITRDGDVHINYGEPKSAKDTTSK